LTIGVRHGCRREQSLDVRHRYLALGFEIGGTAAVRRNTDLARYEQQPGIAAQLHAMSIN